MNTTMRALAVATAIALAATGCSFIAEREARVDHQYDFDYQVRWSGGVRMGGQVFDDGRRTFVQLPRGTVITRAYLVEAPGERELEVHREGPYWVAPATGDHWVLETSAGVVRASKGGHTQVIAHSALTKPSKRTLERNESRIISEPRQARSSVPRTARDIENTNTPRTSSSTSIASIGTMEQRVQDLGAEIEQLSAALQKLRSIAAEYRAIAVAKGWMSDSQVAENAVLQQEKTAVGRATISTPSSAPRPTLRTNNAPPSVHDVAVLLPDEIRTKGSVTR